MAENEATASRSLLAPITRYLRETRAELGKVTWPTREEWLRLSGIVLVVTAIMAVILGVADAIGAQLMELLLRL